MLKLRFNESPNINWLSCAKRDAVALHSLFSDNMDGDLVLLDDEKATRKKIEDEAWLKTISFQNAEEMVHDIEEDLQWARSLIHDKISEKAGNTLCLPYTTAGDHLGKITKNIGIEVCFWGVVNGHKINRPGTDPFRVVRLKNDFIWRLPGKKRKSLVSVYRMKFMRQLKGETGF